MIRMTSQYCMPYYNFAMIISTIVGLICMNETPEFMKKFNYVKASEICVQIRSTFQGSSLIRIIKQYRALTHQKTMKQKNRIFRFFK